MKRPAAASKKRPTNTTLGLPVAAAVLHGTCPTSYHMLQQIVNSECHAQFHDTKAVDLKTTSPGVADTEPQHPKHDECP